LSGCEERIGVATNDFHTLVVLLGAAIGQFVASTATKNCLYRWLVEFADSRCTPQMASKEVPLSDPLLPNLYGYWLLVKLSLALSHDLVAKIKIQDFWNI
jgi:hypothetical protein